MAFSIIDEVKLLCNRLCKSKAEADDLRQIVLYKICRNGCNINRPEYLKTWIRNVVVNAYIDEYCRTRRETPFSLLKEDGCLYDAENNEECVANYVLGMDEVSARSYSRLSSVLTPVERDVMEKTFLLGFSSKDVCENLNISPNVLAKTKNRAIRKMKNVAKLSDCPPPWLS